MHSVLPIPERGIAFANSENVTYASGPMHHASIVDISDPSEPFLLSLLPEPIPPRTHRIPTSPRVADGEVRITSIIISITRTSRSKVTFLYSALQCGLEGLRLLQRPITTRGWVLHPAGAHKTLWPYAGRQAGIADRRRRGRSSRLHLHQ